MHSTWIERLLCAMFGHRWERTAKVVGDLSVCLRCGMMHHAHGL